MLAALPCLGKIAAFRPPPRPGFTSRFTRQVKVKGEGQTALPCPPYSSPSPPLFSLFLVSPVLTALANSLARQGSLITLIVDF